MSTYDPAQPEPEYLGSEPAGSAPFTADDGGPLRGGRGRRTGLVVGAAVAVVAAVGVGAYGVVQLMSGGSAPATAVPANAVGYVSLDLDPSATQKIEAFKMLRKFPAIRKGLGGRDDIRRAVVEQIIKDGTCTDLDYAKDVEPWIGNRVAVAAVPDSTKGALPLVVLQVSDQAKAKAGIRKLGTCGGTSASAGTSTSTSGADKPAGIAFVGDYALITETQAQADSMAKDAGTASLADDHDFTAAMDRAGDPGIVTMYASKDAPDALLSAEESSMESSLKADGGMPKGFISSERKQLDSYRRTFKGFEGATGVVRFKDGAVEAEFTGKGLPDSVGGMGTTPAPDISTLPDTTAAAFSVGFKPGWLQGYLDEMDGVFGGPGSTDRMLKEGEQATGLQLPEDIETMLGQGIAVSVDGSTDLRALTDSPDPSHVPAGIRITGDPAKITPIIDKLKQAAGPDADLVKVGTGDGVVAVGFDKAYVDRLLEPGGLGSVQSFDDVVPHADRATGVLYVNFDAGGGWADQLADMFSSGDARAKANVAPLDALGVSSWVDGDQVQHGLLRLTTD